MYCGKSIPSRSRYRDLVERTCYLDPGHAGKCSEFPYLADLERNHVRVARKIKRDATMTTGAAWKSADAGPNRIDRWVMLQDDASLLRYGVNMATLKPRVVAKLREKAASYYDCMDVAAKLTWLAYQMDEAPPCPTDIQRHLEVRFGPMEPSTTTCIVCKSPLSFVLFENAQRGKAEVETAHSNPRSHNHSNVGFAHRECNIAQGNRTLEEFYDWIEAIISRVR